MEPIESIECRICLDSDERPLLQPCSCSTSYVHEECLQRWRRENIDNDKHDTCEICSADYSIVRKYPLETVTFPIVESHSKCFIVFYLMLLWGGMLMTYTLDALYDRSSLKRLNFGRPPDKKLLEAISDDTWTWTAYYTSYINFIYSMILFAFFFMAIGCMIQRKRRYLRHYGLVTLIYFIYSWNYYILYYMLYRGRDEIDIYIDFAIMIAITSPFLTLRFMQYHNKVIHNMNRDNEEMIVSPRYTPLMEIDIVD